MAAIDVIKWEINDKEFCHKYPSDSISLGAQLIVYPGQTAFFVRGGKICDRFEPGTYTIQSDNIPILDSLINMPFGSAVNDGGAGKSKSPFKAEVWFVSGIARLDLKWGTPVAIQLEDPRYNIIVPVSAFGQYGIKINEPRLFLETLIGNMQSFTIGQVEAYVKGKMLAHLNGIIAHKIAEDGISILDINSRLAEMSGVCQEALNRTFASYGISIVGFSVISVSVPDDDPSVVRLKEAKDMAARIRITGRDIYQMERSYDVLEKAAENEGNGGQMLSMGAGLGVGIGVGNTMGDMAGSYLESVLQTPPPVFNKTYYVYVDGQQIGGLSAEAIMQYVKSGKTDMSTLTWTSGMQNWAALGTFPEFNHLAASDTDVPPPVPDVK